MNICTNVYVSAPAPAAPGQFTCVHEYMYMNACIYTYIYTYIYI